MTYLQLIGVILVWCLGLAVIAAGAWLMGWWSEDDE